MGPHYAERVYPLRHTEKTIFPFPFKLNGIWSWWQLSFRFWTKWNSIWFKIERKTVTTIIYPIQCKSKGKYSFLSVTCRILDTKFIAFLNQKYSVRTNILAGYQFGRLKRFLCVYTIMGHSHPRGKRLFIPWEAPLKPLNCHWQYGVPRVLRGPSIGPPTGSGFLGEYSAWISIWALERRATSIPRHLCFRICFGDFVIAIPCLCLFNYNSLCQHV